MFSLTIHKKEIHFYKPIVMGIINITNDSFYENSRAQNIDNILFTAEKMIKDGATIIDIGGQSTRPNSTKIDIEEELLRVIPAIEIIRKNFPEIILSIDTFYSKVAKQSIDVGANIINDIGGGNLDENMFEMVSSLQVPYICMHIKGNPQTMNELTNYNDVVNEVKEYFTNKIILANNLNIKDFILDVGFGFAKNINQNYELLKNIEIYKSLKKPILVGVSRKSMIYKKLNTTPENVLNGTSVLNTFALLKGADILRVHDVKEAVEAIELMQYLK